MTDQSDGRAPRHPRAYGSPPAANVPPPQPDGPSAARTPRPTWNAQDTNRRAPRGLVFDHNGDAPVNGLRRSAGPAASPTYSTDPASAPLATDRPPLGPHDHDPAPGTVAVPVAGAGSAPGGPAGPGSALHQEQPERETETTAALERFTERPSSRYGPRRTHARNRKTKRRKLRKLLVACFAVVLLFTAGTYGWADIKLHREVDLDSYGERPPKGEGTNYLIVGSDSRDGLTEDAAEDLHAGGGGGRRTDSIMLLHTGRNGTSMVSLPRDSLITIPRHRDPSNGKMQGPSPDKLNATFSYGGPELLARTVEKATGLHIDHYAEIGFAGFVNIVDSIGGVDMCLDRDIRDDKSGADLRKGCQTLDGKQALAFVRQRHQEREGDLGRTRNQQKFLASLAAQAAKPDTLTDPSKIAPAAQAGLETLIVDKDMSLQQLTHMFRAVQKVSGGKGKQINVPVSGIGIPTPKGNVIKWNEKAAKRLFHELREDLPVTEPPKRPRR